MGAHVLCDRLDFTRFSPPESHECWLPNRYLRSLRRSSRNMGRSPATAVHMLRTVSFNWLSASLAGSLLAGFSLFD
jgi:hypothetical protein